MVRALVYDDYWKARADLTLRWAHWIASKEIPSRSTILDVGCGNGVFLVFLQKTKGCYGVGVDVSELAIRLARQRGVRAYVADVDGTPLPFSEDEFDYVCAFDVLEHLYYPRRTLSEMRRVGKHLVIVQANPVWWRNRWEILVGRVPKGSAWRNGKHLYYWSYHDFLDLLRKCGWQPLSIFYRPGVPLIQRFSYKFAENLAEKKPNLFAYAYLVMCGRL